MTVLYYRKVFVNVVVGITCLLNCVLSLIAARSSGYGFEYRSNRSLSDSVIYAYEPGDVILGGLFPVHNKGLNDRVCGEINIDRGIQRLEAMLFTIDEINNNESILPGIKLGTNIFDTCSRSTYALEQSLEFVRASMSMIDATEFICTDGSQARPKHPVTSIAGVIGGSYSTVSIQVANLLRLFQIPQISYASTSAALSDKSRYDFFVRTVPPDTFQAKAMVDIVNYFNWTFVSSVYSEGDYGESGIERFEQEARKRNICIAVSVKIPSHSNPYTFNKTIDRLLSDKRARVVVVFVRVEDARNLLSAAGNRSVNDHFVWIASDGWGVEDVQSGDSGDLVAEGALTIELKSRKIPSFDTYFTNLNLHENTRNPWFKEYWERIHNCKIPHPDRLKRDYSNKMCTGNEKVTPANYKQGSKVQFIYDAVYAIAYALHYMQLDLCPNTTSMCPSMAKIDGSLLLRKYLLNVSFDDGYGAQVSFDSRGDALGRYGIMNYRRNRTTRKYEYAEVGRWVRALYFYPGEMVWAGGTHDIPISRCSEPCKPDEIKHVESGRETCCWICTRCEPWQYRKDEFECVDCAAGKWPHTDMKSCYDLELQYMRWMSVYAIVPMALSILGIIITSFVIITFIRYNDTPMVMASGRELSYVLLSGCLFCYAMSFFLLAKPSGAVCALQRFGVGFGFAVIYSSVLTKTNRISRIFDSARRSARRPPFISPRSQLVITGIMISVQVVFTLIWLVLEPPGIRHYYPSRRRDEVILKCRVEDISFLVSLIYNMLLIIVCTVYAVKTRKIPENFNESKFIGFAMYTTCIIWLAFIPIYFGTLNSFQIQLTTLCVSISLSASVALVCLFTPKLYIIVFQPEKNVRKLTMNSTKKTTSSSIGTSLNHSECNEYRTDYRTEYSSIPSERIRLNVQGSPNNKPCAETETDRDSMASL